MNFIDLLNNSFQKNKSLVCVGLDSDFGKIPEHLKKSSDLEDTVFAFNKEIVDATNDLVCAYKPNTAFYEAFGDDGIEALEKTIKYIKKKYSNIPVILDAKRADIGNTNEGYARFAFDYLQADAITVHPYLGKEALLPFLNRSDKGIFVLCRTSNKGAGELQDLKIDNKPIYQIVAEHVKDNWNTNGNCGLVVGATYPEELHIVRQLVGDLPLLIPGIGTQGGDLEKTLQFGLDSKGCGAIINSSRGIIFASNGIDFAEKARAETVKLKDSINSFRKGEKA